MFFAKKFSQVAIPTATAITLAFAANANAAGLTPGQCYAKADAEAVLKQEGQMPIIMGNRLALAAKDRNANVFFVNKQGYGYNIEGDAPLGQPSKTLCARVAFKNTNLNSPTNTEIPSFAQNIKASSNGINPQKAYANGARIILGAQTYTTKADGHEATGKYIIVSAIPSLSSAGVWGIDSDGRPDTAFDMDKVAMTNNMVELLTSQVASAGTITQTTNLALK